LIVTNLYFSIFGYNSYPKKVIVVPELQEVEGHLTLSLEAEARSAIGLMGPGPLSVATEVFEEKVVVTVGDLVLRPPFILMMMFGKVIENQVSRATINIPKSLVPDGTIEIHIKSRGLNYKIKGPSPYEVYGDQFSLMP